MAVVANEESIEGWVEKAYSRHAPGASIARRETGRVEEGPSATRGDAWVSLGALTVMLELGLSPRDWSVADGRSLDSSIDLLTWELEAALATFERAVAAVTRFLMRESESGSGAGWALSEGGGARFSVESEGWFGRLLNRGFGFLQTDGGFTLATLWLRRRDGRVVGTLRCFLLPQFPQLVDFIAAQGLVLRNGVIQSLPGEGNLVWVGRAANSPQTWGMLISARDFAAQLPRLGGWHLSRLGSSGAARAIRQGRVKRGD